MAIKEVGKKLTYIALFFTSVAVIIAFLAGNIDPQFWVAPAFFGLAFPFIYCIHLVLSLVALVIFRKQILIVSLLPLLIAFPTLKGFVGFHFPDKSIANSSSQFGFMTYNVHEFRSWDDMDKPVPSDIFSVIASEKPEVICMQDFQSTKKRNTVDSIKKMMDTAYVYRGPEDKALFPKNALAIFSKFPIVRTGYILLSDVGSGNQCIYADIQKKEKVFRVYCVHLQSLKFQPNDFARWERGPAHKISFLSRNARRLEYAFIKRSEQVHILKAQMDTCSIPYIVAGDFNDSPASYAVNAMSSGMKNTFREKASGYSVTYDGDMPNFQIDYVLVDPRFQVKSYKVIKKKISDHFPVKVDLQL